MLKNIYATYVIQNYSWEDMFNFKQFNQSQ